jgi:hypothetical protein
MTLDERVIDRMLELGNISDLREDRMDANDAYYAGILLEMVREAEDYVMSIRDAEDFTDMAMDINDALRGVL